MVRYGLHRNNIKRRWLVERRTLSIGSMFLGVVIAVLGFSGNLATAQTTSSLTMSSMELVTAKHKPKPGPCGRKSCAGVPEPSSIILLAAGLTGLGILRRISRKG